MKSKSLLFIVLLGLGLSAGVGTGIYVWKLNSRDELTTKLPLEEVVATSGAAPGYVEDRLCAQCHAELFESYQHVGMANSFMKPDAQRVIEDFENASFFHEPSQRHYEMSQRDGQYFFKRFQLDESGEPINVFQRKVDWILGSGNHSRSYLYQTEAGEMFLLPVAWYTGEKKWNMAPGYDRPDHEGVGHIVRRECMFCHNAYPDVAAGSDAYGTDHVFPHELPQGIGCQRCHGPGADHVRAALRNDDEQAVAKIVNPSRLKAELREDVCNSCHLQPSVAMFGVRRFGRADYSFRPGEPLSEYLVQMDIKGKRGDEADRFEINHHAYRLRQSQCFLNSAEGISCLACHDPHKHVPQENRAAHYGAACAKCHQKADCKLDSSENKDHPDFAGIDSQNCIACHMPKHRAQDVVHVAMTDHKIQLPQIGVDLVAELPEADPVVDNVLLLDPEHAPGSYLADACRAMAALRATGFRHQAALGKLENIVSENQVDTLEILLDLAAGQIKEKAFDRALETLRKLAAKHADHPLVRQWTALCLTGLGKNEEALLECEQAVTAKADSPELQYNYGLLLHAEGKYEEAIKHFEQSAKARPSMFMAWFYLGETYTKMQQLDEAAVSYQRALEIEPSHRRAYASIREVLTQAGKTNDAFRFWKHGSRLAGQLDSRLQETRVKFLPVPEPNFDRLETAVAEQIKGVRQSLSETMAKQDVSTKELADAYGLMGQLYHAYELSDAAEACYQNASRLAPADYRWHHLLGALYEQSGKLEEAIVQFQTAWQLRPTSDAAPVRLGNIYLQQNRLEDAQEQFVIALKVDASSVAAVNGLGEVALAAKKYQIAVNYFEQVLDKVPAANRVHYSLAMAYRGLGELEKAKEHLDKNGTVGLRPNDPLVDELRNLVEGERLYLIRGQLAFSAKRFQEAAEAFGKAIEAKPDSARAHVNLGSSLAELGKIDEALKHYEIALQHDDKSFAAHFNLGILQFRREQFDGSLEHFKTAVDLRPKDFQANRQLAKNLQAVGQDEEAIAQWQLVRGLAPQDEDTALLLADLLIGKGRYEEALTTLDEFNGLLPDRGRVAHVLAALLATCPNEKLRNGDRAVQLATSVYTEQKSIEHGQTLVWALAESGRCEEAAALQKQLIAEAEKSAATDTEATEEDQAAQADAIAKMKEGLLRYETGSPCRPDAQSNSVEKPKSEVDQAPKNQDTPESQD